MLSFTSDERLAILLSVMGDEVAESAFSSMNPTRAIFVKKLFEDFNADPPLPEEIENVVDDFFQYFQTAVEKTVATEGTKAESTKSSGHKIAESRFFPKVTPSHNPVADLNRLDPFQIAEAIGEDHPKTVALVLRKIDIQQAAKVIELFKPEVRSEAVVYMAHELTIPQPIVEQVLKTTVIKACSVEFRPESVDQSQVVADLLRSLPKAIRTELITKLEKNDPEFAEKVKDKLYLFKDILRLQDRDVQKLLGQIETDSLIVALQQCEQELIDKLLNNLSKRARESIIEEMEFKRGVNDEELLEARKKIVSAMAILDENGEIKL
jgi:flagellar motor switch protein FliG